MRLIWWVATFAAGTTVGLISQMTPRLVIMLAPLAVASVCWLARRHRPVWAEGIASCVIGLYAGARADQPPRFAPPLAEVLDTDQKVTIEGWVMVAPEPVAPRPGCRLRVAIERIDEAPARATVALAIAAGVPDLLPGDAVRFTAGLRSVRGLANPDLPDTAAQARANGIDVYAGVGAVSAVKRLSGRDIVFPGRAMTPFLRAAAEVRRRLGREIDDSMSGASGALLHTAVLGERRNTDERVENGFRAAGATHVLSVSGLHLAAIAMVFFAGSSMVLRAIPRLPLWIDPRAAAACLALPAIAFYTLISGSAIATVRSALMMGIALAGIALGRRSTPLVAIAAAVLALLGWSPLVLVDISFQLSVVSVLALALLVPRLTHPRQDARLVTPTPTSTPTPTPTPKPKQAQMRGQAPPAGSTLAAWLGRVPWLRKPLAWVGGLALASVTAGMATAPLVAHHFGEVTPAAPLGNLVLVPLVELLVVPCGLMGAALAAILGGFWGLPLLTVAEWAARAALWVAEGFRSHAPVWLTRSPNVFETAGFSLGFSVGLAWVGRRSGATGSRPLLWCSVALVVMAAASMGGRELHRRWSRSVIVTFLDIGQGDAAVVQLPGGRTLLIDGGGTYDGSFDPGARVVEPFLRARGITHLDIVALSHPHPDHLGGLHRIIDRFSVGCLWTSGDDGHNPEYLRLLAEARAHGVPTPVPSRWSSGDVTVEPLGPFVIDETIPGVAGAGAEHIGPPEGATVNDASLVLRVGYAGRAILFTGDIEANGEGELSGRTSLGQRIDSDILKVPHHGSRTSSTPELLDVVRPRLAVISLGWRNRFHFPRPEVISRYETRGIRVLRTDLEGAITVTIEPGGSLAATCERGCR